MLRVLLYLTASADKEQTSVRSQEVNSLHEDCQPALSLSKCYAHP